MHVFKKLAFGLALFFLCHNVNANNDLISIVVVTSNDYPIVLSNADRDYLARHNINIKILNVDAVSNFESTLSENLPSDESAARAAFQHYINKIGYDTFQKQLAAAYEAQIFSTRYGIKQIPAFVFNEETVLYGANDVVTAIGQYSSSIENQGKANE